MPLYSTSSCCIPTNGMSRTQIPFPLIICLCEPLYCLFYQPILISLSSPYPRFTVLDPIPVSPSYTSCSHSRNNTLCT